MEPEVEFLLILPNRESVNRINRTTIKTENEEEDEFKCEICSKNLASKSSLKQHQKSHKAKVDCKICHKKYSTLSIAFHLKTHELKKQGKRLNCEKCSKTFLNKANLKEHFKTHEKQF
jgi:KRAB domain-containing zinc finger protein